MTIFNDEQIRTIRRLDAAEEILRNETPHNYAKGFTRSEIENLFDQNHKRFPDYRHPSLETMVKYGLLEVAEKTTYEVATFRDHWDDETPVSVEDYQAVMSAIDKVDSDFSYFLRNLIEEHTDTQTRQRNYYRLTGKRVRDTVNEDVRELLRTLS